MSWRPNNWNGIVDKAKYYKVTKVFPSNLYSNDGLRAMFEAGADTILEAYLNSDQFIEDAETQCRESGWREPP